jgi:hypothetical protein
MAPRPLDQILEKQIVGALLRFANLHQLAEHLEAVFAESGLGFVWLAKLRFGNINGDQFRRNK